MYGPNYSGFAFHPKTVRMVGPVHLVVFFARSCKLCRAACFGRRCRSLSAHRQAVQNRTPGSCLRNPQSLRHHSISDRPSCAYPLCRLARVDRTPSRVPRLLPCATRRDGVSLVTGLPLVAPALIPTPDSPTYRPLPENKSGVFHVKHAARFPPTAPPIKPFFSPTPGMFRSRADFAPARPPALPTQTPPSPVHSRSPRSAARPGHFARSAASRRLCRVTR